MGWGQTRGQGARSKRGCQANGQGEVQGRHVALGPAPHLLTAHRAGLDVVCLEHGRAVLAQAPAEADGVQACAQGGEACCQSNANV